MVMRIAAPKAAGSATVIMLHGLGDTGAGWAFLPSQCHTRPSLQHVNFVLPTAPTSFFPAFGDSTTGWFDLKAIGVPMSEAIDDRKGIESSLTFLDSLVTAEVQRGVPLDRIVIGGFSQGGALTQAAAFSSKRKVAGFCALSSMLPMADYFEANNTKTNLDTPMFLAHGKADNIVSFKEQDLSLTAFKKAGFSNLEVHSYPGLPHSVAPEELEHILNFFEKVVPAQ